MIGKDQAIEIATTELTRQGRRVSDYDVFVETDPSNEKRWIVWLDRKGPFRIPGGKHAVMVDKATGQASFMPGE